MIVNILGSEIHIVSVATTQLCTKAAIDSKETAGMTVCDSPIKLYV